MTEERSQRGERAPAEDDAEGGGRRAVAAAPLMVVAIGGSAGGLEAARGLIAGLPAESGIAYILIQHLDPDHASVLAELLSDETPFPVTEIEDGMRLEPDRLHVIPAGVRISVRAGKLKMIPSTVNQGPRLPIDYLLHSLAREPGLQVVAVILSGNGADGAVGLRALHDAGGQVMVQDPAEASHASMPKAAIATGCADSVLRVAEMGPAILALRKSWPESEAADGAASGTEDWIAPVLAQLKRGGHDFSGYKRGTMQRRIERRARMAGHRSGDLADYVARLGTDAMELQMLANDLLINVTGFFRDPAVYETLAKDFLPDLVQDHDGDGPIRVWSAGCSSGEEAWTLAMLMLEEIDRTRPGTKLQVFATDLGPDAIAVARRGFVPTSAGEQVSEARLKRFFIADEAGWKVGPALQSAVVFAVHDLLSDPPFSRIDLISCRNLLIYLQGDAQKRAISLFHFALRPGGLLLLGKAEGVPMPPEGTNSVFSLVSRTAHLYRRNPSRWSPLAPMTAADAETRVANGASNRAALLLTTAPRLPSERLEALETELASIRAQLAGTDLPPDTDSAERMAIYADTLSRNQEFQATNEELITSQEELQSLNEELVALNGQLQETIDRQRTTADDLQNILYSSDVATVFLDMENHIRFFTPSTKLLFSLLASDIGRAFTDLAPRTPDPKLARDIARVQADQQPVERELLAEDGICYSRRIMAYRSHSQKMEGVIITYTDVTDQKKASTVMQEARDLAEAANLAKSRFLAAASHDLRQPLQALVLLQELLARRITDTESKQLLSRLDHTLGSMAAMLDGLLDINRIEAGAVDIERSAFALDALLAETVENLALQADARGLKLRHVKTGYHVVTDRRLLAGMLQNLVSNALKYTNLGGVLVGARRRGDQVEIEVWDSGIGIPAHELEAVFRPYHQLRADDEKGGRGLGLGLAIVRSMGDMLGHRVNASSRPGRGSVFRILVPLAARPAETPAASSKAAAVRAAARALSILVVDDDLDLLDLLGQMLRGAGHNVVTAPDSDGAKAAMKARVPDLLISDFRLKDGLDGLELAEALRAQALQDEGRLLPVIMLTGDISIESLIRFAADDCVRLSKPVRPAALLAAVDAAMGRAPPKVWNAGAVAPKKIAARSLVHVIDDDGALLRELSIVLADAGLPARLHGSCEAFRETWVPGETGCLLIDAMLPGESGLELIAALKAEGTLPPAIVITGNGDVGMAVAAMKAGALDFLEKPVRAERLLESIRRALAHGRDQAAGEAERDAARERLALLTPRQTEVMTRVLAGDPSKNIASDLGLSQRTVENHRAEIMHRTGCKSLPELARLVMTADPEAIMGQ